MDVVSLLQRLVIFGLKLKNCMKVKKKKVMNGPLKKKEIIWINLGKLMNGNI
jgi:hypothetical protein